MRPVESEQSIFLVTHFEQKDIHFRVPEPSHAVVQEGEYFRVQKIESHFHREAIHADLQQNHVCFSPKAMIRELGSVEPCDFCDTIPKVQYLIVFIGIKELCIAFADNSSLTANPEESFTN